MELGFRKNCQCSCNEKPLCIMLSAVGQDKITQKQLDLGAQYYVVKPFDIEA